MPTCPACGSPASDGARFCSACGAELFAERVQASHERKLATMLFVDIVGSTRAAGDQDPERVRATLERFYDVMAEEIAGAGGTADKFAGDAVLAVFGVPAAHEDDAERALHAALSMQRRVRNLFGEELIVRIGVNTGDVVVGRAREGSSFVTGDAVNVAKRIEEATPPGEILAGDRTAAAVRGAFEFGEPIVVAAKGKPDGVGCRPLVRALSLQRPRGVLGRQAAFVGRERELELLQATYRRAVDRGEPHVVTILGDAGVGKTRLVRELWQSLGSEAPEPLRRTGRCLPYGTNAYWPLGEVLKEHLGLLENDTPEEVRRRLGSHGILGLSLGLDAAGGLHPLAARQRLHDEWVELLDELTAERPTVLLLEDLHWAEEPLLDLVERLAHDVQGPLMMLGTARPELLNERPSWGGGRRNASLLWVDTLSSQQAAAMVEELLAADLPASLVDAIVGRAEGNPFYVEELVGALVDQGVLVRRDGEWVARDGAEATAVPDSVQAVVAGRIDLLPSTEKAALQAASLIGRIFWGGPVVELLEGAEPDFTLLEDRDFIRRRTGSSIAGEREFSIKHALTREVAYASLPKARRARLHAAFAAWLERFSGGRDELAPVLAHHLAEAVRPEDQDLAWAGNDAELARLRSAAVAALHRAAQLAVGRCEIEEGLDYLTRALAIADDSDLRSLLWREVGHAQALRYDGEAFWAAMQQSLEVCPDRVTCADTYSLLAFHTARRAGMWPTRASRELMLEWVDRALELSDPGSASRARALIAQCVASEEARPEPAAEASMIAERLDDAELRSFAFDARALADFKAHRYDDALSWVERRLALVDAISDPDHLSDLFGESVPFYAAAGRLLEARRIAERGDEIASRLTTHHRVHGVSYLLELEELLGGWERVEELRERTERCVAENLGTPCVRNMRSLLLCAVASAELGHGRESRKLEASAESLGMIGHDQPLSAPRTRIALARGDRDRLAELAALPFEAGGSWHGVGQSAARLDALAASRATELVEEEAPLFLSERSYLEPFALRALGIVRGDASLLEQAQERFATLGLDWHAAQTDRLLSWR